MEIDRDGWRMAADPPVVFRSIKNLLELPDPDPGGSLDLLDDFLNLRNERNKRLVKAYVVTIPLAYVPRPILQTTGPAGAGKTTAGRVIKKALDPTIPEMVKRSDEDFLQKAAHCYTLMMDNLNSLPEDMVDTICRLVTGEADSKRSLYTDDDDFIYQMKRAVILNGINTPTDRGDAQDRTLPVELRRLRPHEVRDEAELWATFEAVHPKLLGAIFDALAKTIKTKETFRLVQKPRLADWGGYAAAVYRAHGWEDAEHEGATLFLKDWQGVVKVQQEGTLDGSPVAQAIVAFMNELREDGEDEYEDLASNLYKELLRIAEKINIDTKKDKAWPKSPTWLWRRMRESLPLLDSLGIEADRTTDDQGTKISLKRVEITPDQEGGDFLVAEEVDATRKTGDATSSDPADSADSGSTGSTGSKTPTYLLGRLTVKGEKEELWEETEEHINSKEFATSAARSTNGANDGPLSHEKVKQILTGAPKKTSAKDAQAQLRAYKTDRSEANLRKLCRKVLLAGLKSPHREAEIRPVIEAVLEELPD